MFLALTNFLEGLGGQVRVGQEVLEQLKRLLRLRGRDHVPGSSHGDKCQAIVHHSPAANLQNTQGQTTMYQDVVNCHMCDNSVGSVLLVNSILSYPLMHGR